jgi:hypothetical protein
LDLDENDPSQSDAASSSNPEEDEDFIPNTLSKESEAVREVIGDFGVRFFRLCMCVILTQYMMGTVLLLLSQLFLAYTHRNNTAELSSALILVVTVCVLYWSTVDGWISWFLISLVWFFDVFMGGVFLAGMPFMIFGQIALGILSFLLAWWFHGRFFHHIVFLVLIIASYFVVFFFFLISALLIEHTVNEKLKEIAPKLRGEVTRLRKERTALRRLVKTLQSKEDMDMLD